MPLRQVGKYFPKTERRLTDYLKITYLGICGDTIEFLKNLKFRQVG